MDAIGTEEIRAQLESIAERLADMALECLRDALDGDQPVPDPAKVAEERRLTRARHSVEKATHLLGGHPHSQES